jgi:hypothetical protein
MTVQAQNFELFQGDTKQITITVTDENDAILPLTGYNIVWVIYKQTNKELILSKTLGDGITVPTPSNGQIIISITPEDTELITPSTYLHECEISTSPTDVSTVTVGIVKILYSKA